MGVISDRTLRALVPAETMPWPVAAPFRMRPNLERLTAGEGGLLLRDELFDAYREARARLLASEPARVQVGVPHAGVLEAIAALQQRCVPSPQPSPGGRGSSFPLPSGEGAPEGRVREGPEAHGGCPEGSGDGGSASPSKRPIDPELLTFARALRRTQTDAESRLWHLLRNRRWRGLKFRRQHPLTVDGRRHVLDFYCEERRLAIELDGGQHADEPVRDALRDRRLAAVGIQTVRFWNSEVIGDWEAVLERLWQVTEIPSPQPSPGGSGGSIPLPPGEGGPEGRVRDASEAQSAPPDAQGTAVTAESVAIGMQEDFVILRADPDALRTEFLSVAFPSRWDPREKLGQDFAAIHAPVADNAALLAAAPAFMRLAFEREPMLRHVWLIVPSAALDQHPEANLAWWQAALADPQPLLPRLYFRVERQTTWPLPTFGRAVFFIRILMAPLFDVLAVEAPRAAALASALRSMTPAVVAYRGMAEALPRLLAELDEVAA